MRSSATGGGGGTQSEFELLTESDVLEAVREASPSPPPGSPPPSATADLDVTFVNVPSPVSPPAASPSRRDFRLASIRPQIFERLQRSVGRPPPPSATPPPAAPTDSVTLSALQGKYIDEEGVDVAEEAMEVPPPPVSDQPAHWGLVRDAPESSVEAGVRTALGGAEPPGWTARGGVAVDLADRLSAAVTGGWRWLVVVIAALLAAPLPGFLSGLLVGAVLAGAAAAALLPLLRPPPRRLPPLAALTPGRPPVREFTPTLMHKVRTDRIRC